MINYSIAILGTRPGTPKAQIVETKAYGVAQVDESVDINQFAQHIASHGSVYAKGDIVISAATSRQSMSAGLPARPSVTFATKPPSSSCPAEGRRRRTSMSSRTLKPFRDLNE